MPEPPERSAPLVSVVTPVYNGAKYLAECIESVLRQTHTSFEYVISDNGSTDGSLEIARTYAQRDPRVRVLAHDEHLSHHIASWNRAMRLISAEAAYVKVVHADDWLFDECLERMVVVAEQNPSVGLVGAYRLDEDRVNLDGLPPWVTVLPGREVARSHLLGGPLPYLFGSPTSVLVRADLVRSRDHFYFEGNIHADYEACLDVLSESDFGFVHQVLTYSRRHNEAVTAYTRRVGTYLPADLQAFQRWGPIFLSREEYDRMLAVRLFHYATFLVRRATRWPRHEFHIYHRARMREALAATTARQLTRGVSLQIRRSLGRG
ncbi:MAG: glycosyltransferase [Actinomycetota bacterium]|nr:glycosyltransferase [Actinomycetota bacterium]